MDGGIPLTNVLTLAIALVSAGAVAGKLISVVEKVKSLERSRERTGERLAELEGWRRVIDDREKPARKLTARHQLANVPAHVEDDDEGSDEHG